MSKKNKFNLSRKAAKASDNIIVEMQVRYDMDDDRLSIEVARRHDVSDPAFTLRVARQLEHALREVFPKYAEEMAFIELVSGVNTSAVCRCGKE